MYRFLEQEISQEFETVRIFKKTEQKEILLVRHRTSHALFVVRRYTGSAECYQALLGIKSDHLPRIYEAASENGRALVLEEYIEGDSVYEMLKDSCFSPHDTRMIALDVCRALYTLHEHKIVHRDVKPENIILRGNHAVLLDFDAARVIKEGESRDTRMLGTNGYAAPEQYGLSQTDGRTDIYALGVTINLMLTGTHPVVKLAGGRFRRIIAKCTMVQPDDRYNDIIHLMRTLAK